MIIHTYPVNDLREHWTESGGVCPCSPRVDEINGHKHVVHNAWDCRERLEEAVDHAFNEGRN